MESREWQTRKVKRRDAIIQPERNDQIMVVKWLTLKGILHYAIYNEGKRTPIAGALAKAMGLKKGVQDLCIPIARKNYHGMYCEMKRKQGGRLAEEQIFWKETLTKEGYYCVVAKGYDEAVELISDYLDIKKS